MATLPDVKIIESNGNLGLIPTPEDGISAIVVTGIAVAGKFALGDVLGAFTNLKDVEAMGIDEAYDTANSVLAWRHIKDFFTGAGEGSKLYVMVVASTVTMTQIADNTLTHAKKLLQAGEGKIKLLAISRVNAVGTLLNGFEADMIAAVEKAQELVLAEFELHRPVQVLIEGKFYQGTASSAQDFRLLESNRVSVVISQDKDVAGLNAAYAKYANVGYALGVLAAQPVQRNIGRVKNGKLTIGSPALSDGTLMKDVSDANMETLNEKGMIFIKAHAGKEGFFFNDDHTCTLITDDYSYISHGRTMDKAARITRRIYIDEINDDIDTDKTTGKLPVAVTKQFQGIIETAIVNEMVSLGEASDVAAFVDPNQNINATSKIAVKISLRKKGTSRTIEATLAFATA